MIQAKNVDQSLKKRSVFIPIAALSAGTSAADMPLFRCPCSLEVIGVNIIAQGDDVGVDASNTSAWLVECGSTALASKTYDNVAEDGVAFPNKGVVDPLTLSATLANRRRAEGDVITYSITNGATAATPAAIIEIEYVISDSAIFDTKHPTSSAT